MVTPMSFWQAFLGVVVQPRTTLRRLGKEIGAILQEILALILVVYGLLISLFIR